MIKKSFRHTSNIKKYKNDNFYTRYDSIVNELNNYASQFKGRRIHCPCDFWDKDAAINQISVRSEFYEYFDAKAGEFKIESFSVSGYDPELKSSGMNNKNLTVCKFQDYDYSKCDVVTTFPPASLFDDFLNKLISAKVKFIILGQYTKSVSKKFMKLYKAGKIRIGYTMVRDFYNRNKEKVGGGDYFWFTNLKTDKRKPLQFTQYYVPEDYPMIDGTRIINVNQARNIPGNYYKLMAVPDRFILRLFSGQFNFFGLASHFCKQSQLSVNGKHIYRRIIIKRKKSII